MKGYELRYQNSFDCQGLWMEDVSLKIIEQRTAYIKAETLTTELILGEPAPDAFVEQHTIDGDEFTIGVKKN